MGFDVAIKGPYDGWKTPTATQRLPLGSVMEFLDGRMFVYAQAGATQLEIGRVMQESVVVTNHTKDLAIPAAVAIGETVITITNSADVVTEDQYAEGYLFVNDVDGEGQNCKIKSHPADAAGSAAIAITVIEDDALIIALTTSSQVGLRKNPHDAVIVNPTTSTGVPVGVTQNVMIEEYYGWLQVRGPAAVLTNGTVIRGKTVIPSATTAGAVDVYPLNNADASGQQPVVGRVMSVAASTEFSLVDLTLR